ncbi:MAG TPA: pyridoxamine 5'-phosphate oxidase family protein [Candidatus Avidesulfovibrio excrementigallinarum]|nr:pyridoxamine 5'-phosphate oxidase family protein [Candidatus Avidesulfovibrio excrementigallinarum]
MYSMRRTDRQISREEAMELLKRAEYGVLSTVGPDGEAYGVPLTFALDEESGTLLFHCATAGRKLDCLRAHPRAQFVVVADTKVLPDVFSIEYTSAMVEGTVEILDDPDVKKKSAVKIAAKYSDKDASAYAASAVDKYLILRMTVAAVSGKRLCRS